MTPKLEVRDVVTGRQLEAELVEAAPGQSEVPAPRPRRRRRPRRPRSSGEVLALTLERARRKSRGDPALLPGHFLGGLASILLNGLLNEASRAMRDHGRS